MAKKSGARYAYDMATMTHYIGIDGGGTRARAVLTDAAGAVLARAEGGAGRIDVLRPTAGAGALAALARELIRAANADDVSVLCCALAGAGRAEEISALERALREQGVAESVVVTNDALAALHNALDTAPGILLIAGTGSIAWGRNEAGSMARTGGWGELLGDEGSGYAIGLAALRAAVRAHDGRAPDTALRSTVLTRTLSSATEDLVHWSAAATKADIAALAPHVIAATDSDPEAAGIVKQAARDLAEHIAALHARLGPWSEAPLLALSGGLIAPGRPLRPFLLAELGEWDLPYQLLDREIDAAAGAAALARAALATE